MATSQKHSAFGVAVIAFVVAVAVSMGFYQFLYFPIISAKPIVSEEILEPEKIMEISIVKGAVDMDQEDNFVPKEVKVVLTIDNIVKWTNNDDVAHSVTSHPPASDPYSGPFNTLDSKQIGALVKPGESWEFIFTKEGTFPYICSPHPWMKGTITVQKAKF